MFRILLNYKITKWGFGAASANADFLCMSFLTKLHNLGTWEGGKFKKKVFWAYLFGTDKVDIITHFSLPHQVESRKT